MIRAVRLCSVIAVACAVAACGGGGGGGGDTPAPNPAPSNPSTPAPTPAAEVKLTLSTGAISEDVTFGDDYAPRVAGKWSATNLGTAQVYLQVSDNAQTFSTPPVQAALSAGDFAYDLPMLSSARSGTREGILTVRACEDIQCTKPWTGTTQTVAYTVRITPVPDWETLQGNAAHNGFVPIRLDPTRFAKLWEWRRPTASGPLGFINSVATWEDKVLVSEDEYFGGPFLYALNEKDGSVAWKQQFSSDGSGLSPPATSEGRAYVATTGHSATFLHGFDVHTGRPLLQTAFQTQWANLLAPTVRKGQAYVNSGYYGGVVYAFAGDTGVPVWNASGGTYGMNTPAVDDAYVYAHNGTGLTVLDAATGAAVTSIDGGAGMQVDYHASPTLGTPDNVIAYIGPAFSGRASSSTEAYDSRPLRNYSVANSSTRWTTTKTYKSYPAVANGVIYVASNNPKSLDALDEATGKVLWSWVPGPLDVTFHRNVVVTKNLLFVSTNRTLYAIDLATRAPVWASPTPGDIAISANRMMYVATGTRESDARLVAFRLK